MQTTPTSEVSDAARSAARTVMTKTWGLRIAVSLIVIVTWVVLDRKEPFRSHFELTLLGSGVSAVVGGLALYFVARRKQSTDKHGDDKPGG
jgi:NhaP-type Na+/H+ and K+/H+ antiporter